MRKKDLVARFSGESNLVNKALSEIAEKALAIGMVGYDLQINNVAEKVERSKLKDRSASDVMVKVTGDEAAIEAFMDEVSGQVAEELNLGSPSTNIKLAIRETDEKQ